MATWYQQHGLAVIAIAFTLGLVIGAAAALYVRRLLHDAVTSESPWAD